MKLIAVLMICAGCAGCNCVIPVASQPKGHVVAVYVRDKSHHCKLSDHFEGRKYLEDDGTAKKSWTWDSYQCDNEINVIVNSDEEQP